MERLPLVVGDLSRILIATEGEYVSWKERKGANEIMVLGKLDCQA